jgi:Ca2+-binding RTX toxin-like protein
MLAYDDSVDWRGWVIVVGLGLTGPGLTARAVAARPSESETPLCHGRKPTIVGTSSADALHGTPGRDVIWGGPGDDVIYGVLGNDIICGGGGNDLIHGGRGNDLLDGGPGTDRVFGDLGDDKVLGGPGDRDEVSGGLGIDTSSGGPGNDDIVRGDYGYDRMDGGPGAGDIASFATAVGGRGRERGVWASLAAHRAYGDGHDRLYRFEGLEGSAFADTLIGDKGANTIEGGPGNDHILGGGGTDTLIGGEGTDACKGGPIHISCGPEKTPNTSAYVRVDSSPSGGGGLQVTGGPGSDEMTIAYDEETQTFGVSANRGIAAGEGCVHSPGTLTDVSCQMNGTARWLMADMGPGNDRLRIEGSLRAVDFVRLAGGRGNDVIHGGSEDDLIESGPGADRIYGGAGDDGLIGNLPGPTYLYGEQGGDLLAAGGGCAGGALVGGPGQDDASFAETQAHPGTLYISLAAGWAWIDVIEGCHKVRLAPSDEDIEGSFDNDVLIGDSGPNIMLGQPGEDSFYGRGGEDVIVAADGDKDGTIQCGTKGHPSGLAITDAIDPTPLYCKTSEQGSPVAGLHKK